MAHVGTMPPQRGVKMQIEHATLDELAASLRETSATIQRVLNQLKQQRAELLRRSAAADRLPRGHWKREQLAREWKQWQHELDGLGETVDMSQQLMDAAIRIIRGKELDTAELAKILDAMKVFDKQ